MWSLFYEDDNKVIRILSYLIFRTSTVGNKFAGRMFTVLIYTVRRISVGVSTHWTRTATEFWVQTSWLTSSLRPSSTTRTRQGVLSPDELVDVISQTLQYDEDKSRSVEPRRAGRRHLSDPPVRRGQGKEFWVQTSWWTSSLRPLSLIHISEPTRPY